MRESSGTYPGSRSLTRAEVRDVDRRAGVEFGLPGIVLMENAGRNAAALLHTLVARDGPAGPITIVCGKGNNAGDGFVMARHLDNLGHEVRLLLACDPQGYGGDAAVNFDVVRRAGLHVVALADADAARWREELSGSAWIVDALLGTGAAGAPRGAIRVAIEAIVAARSAGACQVFAVDLPSGLDCDTGLAPAACVRADVTGTFVARKVGFDHPGAAIFTGAVHVLDIGVPRTLLHQMQLT